jgi:hypothetical protein
MTCTSPWFGGLTVDHLFADCPNRIKAENQLRWCKWWDLGGPAIDPHGLDVCGMCRHRHNRKEHAG